MLLIKMTREAVLVFVGLWWVAAGLAMDEDTFPADDGNSVMKTMAGETLTAHASSEIQKPEEQFVYNPYGINDYTLGNLFRGSRGGPPQEPFYFYTKDNDEIEEERYEEDGPTEPFSFNEERINLANFARKKKLGDAEFRNLERGDYLDPSNVDRESFLVVTGGLYPNNEIFADVPQLNFGKKAEVEFGRLRRKFQSTLHRYPPYYLDEGNYDPYEEYDPYEYDRRPVERKKPRPSLPPYTQPPRRQKKVQKPVNRKPKKNKYAIKNKGRAVGDRISGPVRQRIPARPVTTTRRPRTPPPTRRIIERTRPTPAPKYPGVDAIGEFGIFGRRINFSPPKLTAGDRIDQQFYGKAEKRHRKKKEQKKKKVAVAKTGGPTRPSGPKRAKVTYKSYPRRPNRRPAPVPTRATKPPVLEVPEKGVARVYHYSTFGNSGNMRGFAYTIVV